MHFLSLKSFNDFPNTLKIYYRIIHVVYKSFQDLDPAVSFVSISITSLYSLCPATQIFFSIARAC